MYAFTLPLHLVYLLLPAWGVALLLTPWVVGWRELALWGVRAAAFWRTLLGLGVVGSLVLLGGLLWGGRDGRMLTYALLVATVGALAGWWRARRGRP